MAGAFQQFEQSRKMVSPMRFFKPLFIASLALVLSAASMAATIQLAGVKVEDHNVVADSKLQLNGAGIRSKFFIKIYVGELYTSKKVHTLNELLAAPGPKRLRMTFLREVDSAPLGKLFTRGIEDNVPKENLSKLVPSIIRMGGIFSAIKSFQPGETIVLDWVPESGLNIIIKDKLWPETFKEPQFYAAMMAIWMGPNPGDWKLKDAMLDVK
jgi:hypothetical protein